MTNQRGKSRREIPGHATLSPPQSDISQSLRRLPRTANPETENFRFRNLEHDSIRPTTASFEERLSELTAEAMRFRCFGKAHRVFANSVRSTTRRQMAAVGSFAKRRPKWAAEIVTARSS